TARRPWSARISVTSSAYSRSPPTGRPRAIRVTDPTADSSRSARYITVASPLVSPSQQLADPQPLRADPVDRRDRPMEHVIAALELGGPLEGEDIERLLDDTQPALIAPGIAAD